MSDSPVFRFDDGAAYEKFMGGWSRSVGEIFLDWIAPGPGLSWLDVGCGNGAFTQLLFERAAPGRVEGVDPSDAQLAFARKRPGVSAAQFVKGDAMALPLTSADFDVAIMALVLHFVANPAKGVAEMARVVRRSGLVAAYVWDMGGGGFPYQMFADATEELGLQQTLPPSVGASGVSALRDMWHQAGLTDIQTRSITVERSYGGFDELWETRMHSPRFSDVVKSLDQKRLDALAAAVRSRLQPDADGRITMNATANAIKGRVPA